MSEYVGVDLGTYAIKVAYTKQGAKGNDVHLLASTYNPVGQFLPSDQAAMQHLAGTIKQLLSEHRLSGKPVYVAIPESMAYTSIISMPYLSDAELASSIHWEAEQHIPVALDEVNLEYDVLYKPKKPDAGEKMKVLLVAAKKDIIDRLVNLFHAAGIDIIGLETILLSSHRALHEHLASQGPVIVTHIGALSTDILIADKGDMVLSYTVQTGGLSLTRAIEKGLELQPQQAEEYKRAYGVIPEQLEGRVRQSLMPVMNIIISEIRKAMQYYQTSHMMQPIQSMLLSGGSAYLPGLPGLLAESFSFEVLLANPIEHLGVRQGITMPENIAAYTPAIGLTLRND